MGKDPDFETFPKTIVRDYLAVGAGLIDAVIIKDLSRLGRHQMQAALYIDCLRQCGVAVISVTEGPNTMDDVTLSRV